MDNLGLQVNMGLESGSSAGLKEYGKTISLDATKKALSILRDINTPHSINIIAGAAWHNHVPATLDFFHDLYNLHDHKPTIYSSEFTDAQGVANKALADEQHQAFRDSLNAIGMHVFKYSFIPFNGGQA
jgi:hypothetical protein